MKVVTQDSKSMLSASSGHSSCFDACVELQQMTLLVDVDTELHDVQKAHLNFARPDEQAEQTADPPSALQSNMPCLRKLVKPTDWEKVRSSIARYVDNALQDRTIPPQTLSKMTVKLPGHGGWLLVEEASMHQIPGSKKIWVLLNGFRPEKTRLVPSLVGISEQIQRSSAAEPENSAQRRPQIMTCPSISIEWCAFDENPYTSSEDIRGDKVF